MVGNPLRRMMMPRARVALIDSAALERDGKAPISMIVYPVPEGYVAVDCPAGNGVEVGYIYDKATGECTPPE